MTAFVTAQDVRDYLNLEGTTAKYSDALLGSNIRTASEALQRRSGRQFERQAGVTKTFTTDGKAQMAIPDLTTATSVTLQSASLTVNASYWLIPDYRNSGIYTAIQVRAYGTDSYLANPEWFERNLDRSWARGNSSLPNDLSITGTWGWSSYPDELLHVTKVLAGWYTRRPSSLLANVQLTPEGNELRYTDEPPEVAAFLREWQLGTMAESL